MAAGASRVGTTFGKYRITGLLGRGGMGEVYQAYDTSKDRSVALKILLDHYSGDEKFRARFQRESRAAAVLQEPHVIPIHDWGEIDGRLYIDMRLIQGETLDRLISRGPLPPQRAVALIAQVAGALDAAHRHGLIHRDVKPANIIVTPADFVYLVDFGIAAMSGDTSLTATGTQIGSVAYMSPERFAGAEMTGAVDVYALACILYELLTGRPPFPTGTMEQTISAHLSSPPPRPSAVYPQVPATFDEVIAHGMAKEPVNRYKSAGALSEAAQWAMRAAAEAQAQVPVPAAPTAQAFTGAGVVPVAAQHQSKSTHWASYAALAAALVALVAAVGGYFVAPAAPADGSAPVTFSAQQTNEAKKKVCDAAGLARSAVQLNTNLQNPVPGEWAGDLAVSTNARLALSHSAQYLRTALSGEPATPPDLAAAVTTYADQLNELAMGYLTGHTPDDSVQQPLRDQLTTTVNDIDNLCPM